MSHAARPLAVVFCALVLFAGLTTGDLFRNEGLRARLAAETLANGDWLVPSLSGEPHLSKPPGMSLSIILCSLPAGQVTTLTARLPSVLAALLTLGVWAWTFRRMCGPVAGWLSLVLLPCSWLWLDRVPSAEIDMVQLAWVSGAMLCLLRAVEYQELETSAKEGERAAQEANTKRQAETLPERLPHSLTGAVTMQIAAACRFAFAPCPARAHFRLLCWWLAAMLCVAGGLFTKWTAPAFFYLTAIPWLFWQGRLSLLLRPAHLIGLSLVVALTAGWLCLVGTSAGWETLVETVGREALLRLSPGHHPRPYPWDELLTFPLSFIAGCLPTTLFAVVTLHPGFVRTLDERQRSLWRLCQCWLWVNLLFWTLAPGHRPRHLLPAQPAVAALAILAWHAWLTGRLRWPVPRIRPGVVLAGLLVCWLAVKLVFVVHVIPARQADRHPRAGGERLAALVPPGETLQVYRLKDDGLLFYYGRPTQSVSDPAALTGERWCLLPEAEWRTWPADVAIIKCAELQDSQGDALVLVRGREKRP